MKIGMQRKHVNDNTPACISMRRRGARGRTQLFQLNISAAPRERDRGREVHESVPSDWLQSSGIDSILNFCNNARYVSFLCPFKGLLTCNSVTNPGCDVNLLPLLLFLKNANHIFATSVDQRKKKLTKTSDVARVTRRMRFFLAARCKSRERVNENAIRAAFCGVPTLM